MLGLIFGKAQYGPEMKSPRTFRLRASVASLSIEMDFFYCARIVRFAAPVVILQCNILFANNSERRKKARCKSGLKSISGDMEGTQSL